MGQGKRWKIGFGCASAATTQCLLRKFVVSIHNIASSPNRLGLRTAIMVADFFMIPMHLLQFRSPACVLRRTPWLCDAHSNDPNDYTTSTTSSPCTKKPFE